MVLSRVWFIRMTLGILRILIALTVVQSDEGIAIWADGDSNPPGYAIWDGDDFSSSKNMRSTGGLSWRIIQGASSPTRDEAIVIGVGEDNRVTGQMYSGGNWNALPFSPLDTSSDGSWWYAFDVRYESQSGNAVLVWHQGEGDTILYRTWDGLTWSPQSRINTPIRGGDHDNLHLEASPISNEMVLIVGINQQDSEYCVVWNGRTWGNGIDLRNDVHGLLKTINVAYEHKSGRALVFYAHKSPILQYRIWDGSNWSNELSLEPPRGIKNKVRRVAVAADPNSNRIAVGVSSIKDAAFWLGVWDGEDKWGSVILAASESPADSFHGLAVAFERPSGRVLAAYVQNDNRVRYRIWSKTWSGEYDGPFIGNTPNTVMLSASSTENVVMLSLQDNSKDAYFCPWNGRDWGTSHRMTTDTGEWQNRHQPFLFLWKPQLSTKPSTPTLTLEPTHSPNFKPTPHPTRNPTSRPSMKPPTQPPTRLPTTLKPSPLPTHNPTSPPTSAQTARPTLRPTNLPTKSLTPEPTTNEPTPLPSTEPTLSQTHFPTEAPTMQPTRKPTTFPTSRHTPTPTRTPKQNPIEVPTKNGTDKPSRDPTFLPTSSLTHNPSKAPTTKPTRTEPTPLPTPLPTSTPTRTPTIQPTLESTHTLTNTPTTTPTASPSTIPQIFPPSFQPTTTNPTLSPTGVATLSPTQSPTHTPTQEVARPPASKTSQPSVANTEYDKLQHPLYLGTGQVCSNNSDCMSRACRNGVCMASPSCYPLQHKYGSPFDKNRINIVFVASAFDTGSHKDWHVQVNTTLATFGKFNMFSKEVEQLNVFFVDPPQLDPSFCDFGCSGVDRLLCCDMQLAHALSSKCFPIGENLQTVVIHNSRTYGGAGYTYENVATVSVHPQAPLVAVHELGHSLFQLADEYWYGYGNPLDPNCDSRKKCKKWADLIGRKKTPAGYDPVRCVPGCSDDSYYIGARSFMEDHSKPVGAVNERFTCCTYQVLTKSMPSYCDAFDFSPGYLFDYCKTNDYQDYGSSNYDTEPKLAIPGIVRRDDEHSKYVYVSDPVLLTVSSRVRRNGNSGFQSKQTPLQPGLFPAAQVIGDFKKAKAAAKKGFESLLKVVVIYRTGKEVLLFGQNTTIEVPLPDKATRQKNEPSVVSRRSDFVEVVLNTRGREIRTIRSKLIKVR